MKVPAHVRHSLLGSWRAKSSAVQLGALRIVSAALFSSDRGFKTNPESLQTLPTALLEVSPDKGKLRVVLSASEVYRPSLERAAAIAKGLGLDVESAFEDGLGLSQVTGYAWQTYAFLNQVRPQALLFTKPPPSDVDLHYREGDDPVLDLQIKIRGMKPAEVTETVAGISKRAQEEDSRVVTSFLGQAVWEIIQQDFPEAILAMRDAATHTRAVTGLSVPLLREKLNVFSARFLSDSVSGVPAETKSTLRTIIQEMRATLDAIDIRRP